MNARLLFAVCAALLTGGCVEIPDLGRGQVLMQAGDPEGAERNFRQLADMGYPEAQLKLARLYSQEESPEALQEAAHWYRSAMAEDPALAVPLARVLLRMNTPDSLREAEGLLKTADAEADPRSAIYLLELYTDYPERDRKNQAGKIASRVARMDEPDADAAVVRWYRSKAATEPKFAELLLKRCEKARAHLPDCYADLARHYRAKNAQGELQELSQDTIRAYKSGAASPQLVAKVGWMMVSDEYQGEPRPEEAYAILRVAADDAPIARVRMARVLIEHPQVDPEAKPEQLLLKSVNQDYPEAELALGRLYMRGLTVPADPVKAEGYFLKVANKLPAANFYLGRLYQRGDTGRADPVKSARYLLLAARQGYAPADLSMAKLYSENRGAKPDLANAWAFASIAAQNGVPNAEELLAQLRTSASAKDKSRGKDVMQRELSARQALNPAGFAMSEMQRSKTK